MGSDFWEAQAKTFGHDVKAVNFDPIEEELEFDLLDKLIGDNEMVCDLGCGNGRTIFELAKKKKGSLFFGVDCSQNMIAVAQEMKKELGLSNVNFYALDSTLEALPQLLNIKADKVLTKRLLINIKGEAKFKAIQNIYSILKDSGTYIMIECFLEPLEKINKIRIQLGLSEIKVKHFNEYLTQGFFDKIKELFYAQEKIDFESLYYFISRIYNASLCEDEPDYYAPMNKLSAKLLKDNLVSMRGYAPEIAFLLRKNEGRNVSGDKNVG